MKTVNVTVTLESYLAKFVNYYVTKNNMKVTRTDFIGPSILMAISKPPKFHKSKRVLNENDLNLKVPYNSNYTQINKPYISDTNMGYINSNVKRQYEMVFLSHVMIGIAGDNSKINGLIEQFRAKYNINEEDLSFDASLKAFYRLRKRANSEKSIKNINQYCPFFSDMVDVSLLSNK